MAGLLDEPYIGYPQLARRKAVPNTDVETSKGLLRGISYYPYDLLGAPIDLMNMALTPLGMGSKTPVMGSDYLQGLAQRAGLSLPKTDSSSENIGRILSSIINPAAGARAVGKVIDPAMQVAAPLGRAMGEQAYRMTEDMLQKQGMMPSIVAYHGTPHNIQDGFDISKIGTGEGAQAYGRGIYFAENPSVAKEYAMTVPKSINNDAYNAENIANRLFKGGYDEEYITNRIKSVLPNADDKVILNALDNVKKGNIGGNVYKVDIPDEYLPNMINSDNQLKDQPESIKKFVKKNIKELTEDMYQYKPQSQNDKVWDRLRGIDLIMWANEKYGYENAAKFLNSEGIKGVKYLDQGSRSAGKGTSNFVVFDPTDVKILEKNSQKVESLLD